MSSDIFFPLQKQGGVDDELVSTGSRNGRTRLAEPNPGSAACRSRIKHLKATSGLLSTEAQARAIQTYVGIHDLTLYSIFPCISSEAYT
jgi:hypothetical protein